MLILQGERDYQVTMVDFQNWKAALSTRSDVQFKSYPDLYHLFISGTGKSTPQEYQKPGSVAAVVIDDIAAWVKSK
jgi:alpha-beta hydrolase superfamily lysophospholipase